MELISAMSMLAGASWTNIIAFSIGTTILLWAISVLWQLLDDPLAGIPGPILCRFSRLPYIVWVCTGRLPFRIKELHDQYGEVVRVAPDEVQFINPDAWKDIFGHKTQGAKEFPKDLRFYPLPLNGVRDLLTADHANHPRLRKLLSPAFAEKTLRDQESLITSYMDMMVSKLRGLVTKQDDGHVYAKVDMVKWYNYCTFDVIGDLTFGKPFYCMESNDYHPWVSSIFRAVKAAMLANNAKYLPAIKHLVMGIVISLRPHLVRDMYNRLKYSTTRVTERLASSEERPDFFSHILKAQDSEHALSKKELDANADLLVFAGSETTAGLLAGATYLILRHEQVRKRLVEEIRSHFATDEEINFIKIHQLPYLNAVIQEACRMYPPIPVGPPRTVPSGGGKVCGYSLPEKTAVAITHYASGHCEINFSDPETFIPDRWLPDAEPRFASDRRRAVQTFAMGPRNCIGQNLALTEVRISLIKMLWHFDAELAQESKNWIQHPVFGLWQKPALMVNLKPRVH